MKLRPSEIKTDDGKNTSIQETICDICDGNLFQIIVTGGHNHLICANPICKESYCQIGACTSSSYHKF